MLRRRTSQRARALPALLFTALVLVAVAALGACGGGEPSSSATATTPVSATSSPSPSPTPTPTTSPVATTKLSVYFLRGEELGVAERRVPQTKAVAAAAMRELCVGPTAAERAAGLSTAIPSGTAFGGIRLRDGVALVDLSSAYDSGGGSLSMTARIAQVVYTLTQFPGIKAVSFALDGEPISTLGGEGVAVAPPQRRADWVEFEPPIFVEDPGVGATLSSPFVLLGTASVFEGSFLAELRDNSGRRIVRMVVQATRGAPERGDFRKTVAFTTAATKGTLIVYAQSMEDGSRQDEVRIPVTFTR
jgi:germination protein M